MNDRESAGERERERARERERERTRQGKAPRGATRGKRWDRKKAYVVVVGRGWRRRKGGGEREDEGGGKRRGPIGCGDAPFTAHARARALPGGKKTNPRYD